MEGGIQEWHGLTAEGSPEGGVAYFAPGTDAADMASLAWALEENTRLFYTSLNAMRAGTEEASLFMDLVEAEEHHKQTLESIHSRLSDEPVERFFRDQASSVLEGGVSREEALAWAEGKPARKVLAITIGMEANAYDRYLRMVDKSGDEAAREVFQAIAGEEKGHLEKLSRLMDEVVRQDA